MCGSEIRMLQTQPLAISYLYVLGFLSDQFISWLLMCPFSFVNFTPFFVKLIFSNIAKSTTDCLLGFELPHTYFEK